MKAASPPNTAIVCDYSLDETHRTINKKFPHRAGDLELFLYRTLFTVELITAPTVGVDDVGVRDVKDRPIFCAAVKANADVLITGDKDLLEYGSIKPRIITPAKFMSM